jgi:hypothetical protein
LKVILEGELTLKDKATGEVIEAKAGDVLKIAKGEQGTLSSHASPEGSSDAETHTARNNGDLHLSLIWQGYVY